MKKKNMTSRRNFLKGGAALGGLMILPTWCIGRQPGPNDKLNIACVGAGGMARYDLIKVREHPAANIVALCDVDDRAAAESYKEHLEAAKFKDYRVMLEKMGNDIDAVLVGTPDHTHFPASAWAMVNGKHVYCEKPVVRTVAECRELARLAKRHKVVTQMGNQGHTLDGWRVMREWAEKDVFGKVSDVYTWSDRPGWPQGALEIPAGEPIPAELDWKLWLGVAPHQEYTHTLIPGNWRGMRHYGTGAVGDMACHIVDAPYSGLQLGLPTKLWGDCTEYNDYSWPRQTSVHMEFDSPYGVDGKLTLHWCDGGLRPENVNRVDQDFINRNANQSLTVGEKYTVISDCYGSYAGLYGERDKMIELKKEGMLEPNKYERSAYRGDPQKEWVECCLQGNQAPSNFEYATGFTEVALLFLVAFMGTEENPLIYDAKKMRFKNSPEATKMLHSLYSYNKDFLPSEVRLPKV